MTIDNGDAALVPDGKDRAEQVLARVQRMGTCGADVGHHLGKHPQLVLPCLPGHQLGWEFSIWGRGALDCRRGEAPATFQEMANGGV